MGGWTTKIHAAIDALGNPLRTILSVGQQADIKQAESLVIDYEVNAVIADKGYDAGALVAWLTDVGIQAVILAKKNWLIEQSIDPNLTRIGTK